MSDWNGGREPGPIPARWLHCPRKAVKLVQNKFLAFKTPLNSQYDPQVPEESRFSTNMLFASLKSQKVKLGLWVDLTNTSRFYKKRDVEATGCRYLKLQCRGHGETPSEEQTRTFVEVCKNFISQNPLEIVGVHCTHGFNRTGFMIISYLVEADGTSVDAALAEFATARPPGIYKDDYIRELYKRYDDADDAPPPPPRPPWCLEYDDSNVDGSDESSSRETTDSGNKGSANKKKKREYNNRNPVFMAGIPGVTPVQEQQRLARIQGRVQELCRWESTGFPGSQPVSMDTANIELLAQKPYRVSWKADGTRYMMLIEGNGDVYFVDRDNSVFEVEGVTFPHPEETNRLLKDTLLDGEMVIDRVDGREYPRYLAYDVITYDGHDVTDLSFHPERYNIIEREVMGGKHRAFKEGRIRREREPFSFRLKQFWDVTQTGSLLGEKFAKQLGHEPDGLIFQPAKEPYIPGPSPKVLKWKPASLNSVDFKLKVVTESGEGILPRKIGQLFVGGLDVPFAQMKLTKATKDLNSRIVECKFENGSWVFMRERTDKSFPNSCRTAQAVCKSINDPITAERLLDFIAKHRFPQDDSELMPPPAKRHRTVLIWCTKDLSSKEKKSLRVNIEYDHVTLVRWSPDGKAFIAHKALGNNVEVYKLSKRADGFPASATKALEFPKHHTEDVTGMDIACSGRYIMTCSKANDLVIWDLKGQILAVVDTYLGSTHRARLSPCGRFVAASGFTPDVKVWEVGFAKSGEFKQVSKAFDLAGHSSGIYDFGFNSDTSRMASVSKDGTYRFYDTKIEFEKGEDPHILAIGTWDGGVPANLALSPNGEVVVVAHGSSVSFYSTISGSLDTTIEDVSNGPVVCLAFDATGDYILVAGDKQIKIFRNVAGYRTTMESARIKLKQRQTSATKERLEKTIADCKSFLEEMGEWYSE